jgi:hypothetical protein
MPSPSAASERLVCVRRVRQALSGPRSRHELPGRPLARLGHARSSPKIKRFGLPVGHQRWKRREVKKSLNTKWLARQGRYIFITG